MKVTQIYTANFRNYHNCCLNIDSMINIFYGKNAQGKTNLLEAIFYAAFGMSYRTSQEEDLIKLNTEQMAVGINFLNIFSDNNVKIKKQLIEGKFKKELFLDGNKVKPKEHYGTLNVVMFSPEDLQLIKGEPTLRRRFFDMEIAQTDKLYYDLLVKYNRILQQRNKLLKDIRDKNLKSNLLDTWNKEFATIAAAIIEKRNISLKKMQSIAQEIYSALAGNGEIFTIEYEQKENNGQVRFLQNNEINWQDYYYKMLLERQTIDILRGNTGVGPHRDDLLFLVNNKPLKSFGSQGQQRSAALALKLAQLKYVEQEIGEFPVLLLDDVMSELDNNRRQHLLKFINGKVQTFITVNDKELIPNLNGNSYYYIENGEIAEG